MIQEQYNPHTDVRGIPPNETPPVDDDIRLVVVALCRRIRQVNTGSQICHSKAKLSRCRAKVEVVIVRK